MPRPPGGGGMSPQPASMTKMQATRDVCCVALTKLLLKVFVACFVRFEDRNDDDTTKNADPG